MKVRFAVSVGLGSPDPDHLAVVVTEAESRGFDTLWFSDVPSVAATDPLVGVAYAAAATSRVKLGANFVPFGHEPFSFARSVAQLDRLSGGRLLVTLVPGLDLPGERAALGVTGRHRGRLLDQLIPQLRAWWSGKEVRVAAGEKVNLPVLPVQEPLEIWFGGSGPEAVKRAGRLADGWLGSIVTPDRAGALREAIEREAAAAGRAIDPEHFGLSIGYARELEDVQRAVRIRQPRAGDPPLSEVVPVGSAALRGLIGRLTDVGLSKFVVRPVGPVASWSDDLAWLAETVLDLQT
jgi:probable F420-dependent oxidoreductase